MDHLTRLSIANMFVKNKILTKTFSMSAEPLSFTNMFVTKGLDRRA